MNAIEIVISSCGFYSLAFTVLITLLWKQLKVKRYSLTYARQHHHQFIIVLVTATICCCNVNAQPKQAYWGTSADTLRDIFSAGVGLQHGFIFAHSPEVENTKGANPTGVELVLSWQRSDAYAWDLCNCFPRKGLSLTYFNFDNNILGKGYSAAYFLEPAFKIGPNTYFALKGSAGITYLTNPFDSVSNPSNRSYSTHASAFLSLGVGVWFKMSNNWWLNSSLSFNHVSNGGFRQPNKGINWPTAGLAVSYQKNPREYYTGVGSTGAYLFSKSPRFDFSIFGLAKRVLDNTGNSRRLLLAGIALHGSKQVGRINALSAGIELFRDEALKSRLRQDSLDASPVKAGLLAGHAFILGKFLFNQQLGLYVFDQTPYFDRLYHRWGIVYRINKHVGAGLQLLAHRQVADFVDLRIVYSIQ